MRPFFKLMLPAALLATIASAGVQAHHSFTATYFEDRTVQIEGKLLQFMFRNPHSFVHVEAPDESGQLQRWAIEWGGAAQLTNQGLSNQTLHVGDVVTQTVTVSNQTLQGGDALVGGFGAISGPFAGTGVLDLARAIRAGRPPRASAELGFHVLDAMVSITESAERGAPVEVESTCDVPPPVDPGWDPSAPTLA